MRRAVSRLGALGALLLAFACSGGGTSDTSSGGSSGTASTTGGGAVASGGSTPVATGGATATQGGSAQPGTGGVATSSGGSAVSGGSNTGGTTGGSANGGTTGGAGTASGGAPASGGSASGGRANAGGAGSSAGAATGGATAGNGGSATGGSAAGANGALTFSPGEGIYSYPRTTANGPSQTFRLKNDGASAATVNLSLAGTTPGAFRITSPASLSSVMLAAGASVDLAVQFVPNGTGVAAAPAADNGGVAVNALLSAAGAGPTVQAKLFGLVMTIAGEGSGAEPTLGQILTTLGYAVDVGTGLRDHLANSTSTALQGSEVALPRFVRAATGSVTLRLVARFSPSGPMPFGYYTVAAPNCANATSYAANCHVVGSMTTNTDANTSNGSRMLNPPVDSAGATGTFDPGSEAFGIWSYTDQASQKVSTGGTATNGDYAYSENSLNIPSSMHRVRVWPLRDRAGTALSNSYLIGVEEASNGDYQDYVFVITNVKAP